MPGGTGLGGTNGAADAAIQIVGRATRFDGRAVTWAGIGQSNVELWQTSAILEDYVLATDFKHAGTGT